MRKQIVPHRRIIKLEPLTRISFWEFGSVLENPRRPELQRDAGNAELQKTGVSANQGTAIKFPNITPLINGYGDASRSKHADARITMFVCKPRNLRGRNASELDGLSQENGDTTGMAYLDLRIMERHPYTTQTFLPLGLTPEDLSTSFVVIVARTETGAVEGGRDAVHVESIRAFVGNGSQGVTYGKGTWHAPMIVVGRRNIEFAVVQYMNDVAEDDCEEIELAANGSSGEAMIAVGIGSIPNLWPGNALKL
ncbi:hypothetical protein MMC25_005614 [Agyrium rufum]|nr:hypothetical protein [Agyrium rufum]